MLLLERVFVSELRVERLLREVNAFCRACASLVAFFTHPVMKQDL